MLGMISAINHIGSAVLVQWDWDTALLFLICGYSAQVARLYDDVPLSTLCMRECVCVCCAKLVTQQENSIMICMVG